MAIKRKNKINAEFNSSTMSDLVFLLLIFFMITSTLISPNALKLLLPKSNNQVQANKPITSVSINKDLNFYVETKAVGFDNLENYLQNKIGAVTNDEEAPTISLHAEKSVPIEEVVKVMNIAKNNTYKLILATSAK